MQLYALENDVDIIFAEKAHKTKNYFCLECKSIVKRRGGDHRRTHFYHLQKTSSCRLSQKSMSHLQVQRRLLALFPEKEAQAEQRFPKINRIADVVWNKEKIVFEVQCSPMSKEEVLSRTKDYASIGYHVIWILHDSRYNQSRLSSLELGLKQKKHGYYFTNINAEGSGFIYDQIEVISSGSRKKLLSLLPISPHNLKNIKKQQLPWFLKERQHFPFSFEGDALALWNNDDIRLKELARKTRTRLTSDLWKFFCNYLLNTYKLFFQILLEKACK